MKFLFLTSGKGCQERGIIIPLVLVFGAAFLVMMGGILGFVSLQERHSLRRVAWNQALHLAEAGANYYRWHINHTPQGENADIQDGNDWCCKVGGVSYSATSSQCQDGDFTVCGTCDGQPCYVHPYIDPETNTTTGEFVLKIKAKRICGKYLGVYVYSTGYTAKYPEIKRTVLVKYASTPIAEYGSIIDEAVWRAPDEKTYGKFHTNHGMRMDAVNNSLVTSEVNQWVCTPSFNCCGDAWGCNCEWSESLGCYRAGGPWWWCNGICSDLDVPEGCVWSTTSHQTECNGVCGAGGPKDLWKYPAFHFNFAALTNDFNGMKQLAEESETERGKDEVQHLSPSGAEGYHIILHPDRTYDIKRVNSVGGIPNAYDIQKDSWIISREVITSETTLKTNEPLPSDCGLIFVEDNLWIEGTVKGKVTIAAAVPDDDAKDPNIFINNNLDYTTLEGPDSLALIAENSVLITAYCAGAGNDITARGVFVAQKGYVGRRGYWSLPYSVRVRNRLLTYGTIVSEIRGEVTYILTNGTIFSGFQRWDGYFDERLARDPPPLLPYVSPELQTISWEEIPSE